MDRWSRMTLRLYTPAVAALGLALLVMIGLELMRGVPMLSGAYGVLRWFPALALLAAVAAGAVATLRLWRWKRSGVDAVCECGGMLGRMHHGLHGRYRVCLACGAHIDAHAHESDEA